MVYYYKEEKNVLDQFLEISQYLFDYFLLLSLVDAKIIKKLRYFIYCDLTFLSREIIHKFIFKFCKMKEKNNKQFPHNRPYI